MSVIASAKPLDDYAHELVPDQARGSAWRVFFIVAGSMAGLPTFILAANIFSGLGFRRGLAATLLGSALSALLGGMSSFCGSTTRMGLAVLAEATFGHWGGRLIKLVIAFSLIGWFAVEIAVLGATLSGAIRQILGVTMPPAALSVPFAMVIALVTSFGTKGLERIGQVLVPLLLLCLLLTLARSGARTGLGGSGTGAIGFGAGVSAIIGSYIVGIVIQPDYSRFVRSPVPAGAATAGALGLAFPAIVLLSAIPTLSLHQPNLIGAMILLGLGVPALLILTLGAAIDTSACLYSGSLPVASELRHVRLGWVIAGVAALSVGLALAHIETYFIGFLVMLGVALPPIAAVQVACTLSRGPAWSPDTHAHKTPVLWWPMSAWILGAATGALTGHRLLTLTGLPALDSVLTALLVLGLARIFDGPTKLRPRHAG